MKVKSSVKAGGPGLVLQHNQTVVRKGLRVKSKVKAARPGIVFQHSQAVKGLRIKTGVRSGGPEFNHNQTVSR
ncbi:MAG TPA: hypothetical protein VF586_03775 [Pyrinomonadaceae bacterium]|jgi:hypothetical protein